MGGIPKNIILMKENGLEVIKKYRYEIFFTSNALFQATFEFHFFTLHISPKIQKFTYICCGSNFIYPTSS